MPTQALSPVKEKSLAKIAFAAKFGNFGEEVKIEIPGESISLEEFMDIISEIVKDAYGSLFDTANSQSGSINASAKDARRQADLQMIRSALELYKIDCGIYPPSLVNLNDQSSQCASDEYLQKIPLDPEGSEYYYRVSSSGNEYDVCAKLESPPPVYSISLCPNPIYNYRLQNP